MCEPTAITLGVTAAASMYMQHQMAKKQENMQNDAMRKQEEYQAKLDTQAKEAKDKMAKDAFNANEIDDTMNSTSFAAQEEERKRRQGFQSTQASKLYGDMDSVSTLKKTLGGI